MSEQLVWSLIAALAGGVGAALRFIVEATVTSRLAKRGSAAEFVWGIWVVNLSGSLAIGVLVGAVGLEHPLAVIFGAGFLGGYTTFSTASIQTVQLLRRGRVLLGAVNGVGQLVCAVAFAAVGLGIGSLLLAL